MISIRVVQFDNFRGHFLCANYLQAKLAPLQACLKEAADGRTRDDFENHTKAIGEAMGASWIVTK